MPTGVAADAPLRLSGHLDLGDEVAGRRVRAGERDAGRLADHAAPAIAPDEVRRPKRRPSDSWTSTPASSWSKPVTSRPRRIGTASSPTQPARMRSMWRCQSASP